MGKMEPRKTRSLSVWCLLGSYCSISSCNKTSNTKCIQGASWSEWKDQWYLLAKQMWNWTQMTKVTLQALELGQSQILESLYFKIARTSEKNRKNLNFLPRPFLVLALVQEAECKTRGTGVEKPCSVFRRAVPKVVDVRSQTWDKWLRSLFNTMKQTWLPDSPSIPQSSFPVTEYGWPIIIMPPTLNSSPGAGLLFPKLPFPIYSSHFGYPASHLPFTDFPIFLLYTWPSSVMSTPYFPRCCCLWLCPPAYLQ